MSETFDEAIFGEPPMIYTQDGEGRLPKDIWVTACEIAAIPDEGLLRTLIATSLLKEREGWGRRRN